MDTATITAMQLAAMRNRPATVNADPFMRFGTFRHLVRMILDNDQLDEAGREMELRALLAAADQHEAEQPTTL